MQLFCPECNAGVPGDDLLICKSCNGVRPPFGWPSDPLIGILVDGGRYQVERRLGAGGFGAVYEVTHTLVGQRRAMKVMSKQLIGVADVQRRFIDEWDILDKIEHPNIVRCYEIGILPESRQPFMLLDLLDGHSIFDEIWPRGAQVPTRMDPSVAARVGWQIAQALTAAHARGLLHRDLKPDNVILLNGEHEVPVVKVIDFGIAKILGSATAHRKTSRVVGTPEYMAPEQFTPGVELDERLDLWQLGAVMFFIITGWSPYTAGDDDAYVILRTMKQRAGCGPRPSEQYPRMADFPGLDALVGELLSSEPSERPSNAEEVVRRIDQLFESELTGAPAPGLRYHTDNPMPYRTPASTADTLDPRPGKPVATPGGPDATNTGGLVSQLRRIGGDPAVPSARVAAPEPTARQEAPVGAKLPRRPSGGGPPKSVVEAPAGQRRPAQPAVDKDPARRELTVGQQKARAAIAKSRQVRRFAWVGILLLVLVLAAGIAAATLEWDEMFGADEPSPPSFVRIEPDSFEMGSHAEEAGRTADEAQHKVTLTHILEVQTTEVTQAQWTRIMGSNPSFFADCGDDCPVESVSWWDALAYLNQMSAAAGFAQCYELKGCSGTYGQDFRCETVQFVGLECTGYRLPTEAEWEYVARGKTSSAYYGGAMSAAECEPVDPQLDRIAWYCGNAERSIHPVGLKLPNRYGLHDVLGNVREWVWDWNFGAYATEDVVDPLGPEKGAGRSYRGGGWMNLARDCRSAARGYDEPHIGADSIGLRPFRTLKQ